jgi:hypothetical protein
MISAGKMMLCMDDTDIQEDEKQTYLHAAILILYRMPHCYIDIQYLLPSVTVMKAAEAVHAGWETSTQTLSCATVCLVEHHMAAEVERSVAIRGNMEC